MRTDAYGCVRMRTDAYGCVRMRTPANKILRASADRIIAWPKYI